MRSLQAALICASFVLSLVTAIPTVDLTIAHDVARSPSTVALAAGPAVTHYYDVDGNRLATIKATDNISDEDLSSLAILANDQIITEAFNTAAKITEVVCTKAGPTACIATALVAVIGVFFLAWKSSGRRELDHVFLVDYPPAAGYSTRYRLENEAPEGDWRLIGNATVNGVFHTIHYKRNGTLNGLRSVQFGSVEGISKRAEDNDGGVVVDYNWDSLSETAYNSFDSTQTLINDFSNDIAADLEDANSIQGCADFADSDGYLDAGLVSIGWNNVPFRSLVRTKLTRDQDLAFFLRKGSERSGDFCRPGAVRVTVENRRHGTRAQHSATYSLLFIQSCQVSVISPVHLPCSVQCRV